MTPYSIHVGSLVRAELVRQHQTVAWLANRLSIQRANCYRILHASSIHVEQLARISIVMQHDFFKDCSAAIFDALTVFQHTNHTNGK